MSSGINVNPLNDITKVYLNQIANAKAKETEKDIERWTQSEEKKQLDPVGQEDGDIDNDGDEDSSDKYLMKRRKAVGKAIAKKKGVKEDITDILARLEKKRISKGGDPEESPLPAMKKYHADKKKKEMKKESTLQDITKVYLNQVAEHHQKDENGNTIPHENELDEAERKLGDRLHRKRKLYDRTVKKAMDFARREGEAAGHARYRMGSLDREMDGIKAKMKEKEKKKTNEGRTYTWRDDLREVMTDDTEQKKVKEKTVKNKININPKLGEAIEEIGGEVLEAYTVTNADKKGNTPAYQGYKAGKKNVKTGKPMYKAADHMKEEEKKKKKGHDCASKVKHEEYGIGNCIKEMHTLDEDGHVTHYDVMFSNKIIKNVPADTLEVLEGMYHEHYVNDEKNEEVFAEADKKGKGSGTKDACYHKVKSRYSVWPSAYASGALVKCRKKGAANWGNSSKKEEFEYQTWKTDAILEKVAAWQRKEGKRESGGLNQKGVDSYRRENPGSKLKTAVTTKPSKLKKGSKAANRRKSFCARMGGMKKRLTSAKTARDPDSRINKALRKWNCSYEPQGTPIMEQDRALDFVRKSIEKKHGKGAIYDPKKDRPPSEAQKKKVAVERKKRQDADNKAYAARAKKAGFKSTQDYTNVVARYGSEDNYRKGKGLGT